MSDEIYINPKIVRGLCNSKKAGEIKQINKNIHFIPLNNSYNKFEDQNYYFNIKSNNYNYNNKERYIGILNDDFEKDIFGYISFNQGDEYYGQISEEKKQGFGIYSFNSDTKNGNNIYIGHFSENKINGNGILINITNYIPKYNLNKYICHIGTFENGQFKKGKIYIYDNGLEQLKLKNDEELKNNINGEKVIKFERKENKNIYTEGTMKDNQLIEGFLLDINNDGSVENQFFYKMNEEKQYIYEYFGDDDKIKEVVKEFNELHFNQYNANIQEMLRKSENLFEKIKEEPFRFDKDLINEDKFKSNFDSYFKLLLNEKLCNNNSEDNKIKFN